MYTDKLFTGQREMAGLGIYHYGARFYSLKLGRFLSADTIVPGYANPQNLNRFSYVRNNPLRYTDPTGHLIDEGCGCGNTGTTRRTTITVVAGRRTRNSDSGRTFVQLPSQPTIPTTPTTAVTAVTAISGNNPSIGEPRDLGEYESGIWVGGGQPNDYYVGGYTPEEEGDRVYLTGSSASLDYGAVYSIEFYEHGAVVSIDEYYSLSRNTIYTDIASAGALLYVRTSDGIAHNPILLGEFEVARNQERTTSIVVYGSYPAEMNITIIINLSQTLVVSAPLPPFEFFTNPSEVYP